MGAILTSLPITDGEAPFVWYETFHLWSETGTGADDAVAQHHRLVVDSKAMRMLRPDQELVYVVETLAVVGAPVVDTGFAGRFLLAD